MVLGLIPTLGFALALATQVADAPSRDSRAPARTAPAMVPVSWRQCRQNRDCTVIPFSCSGRQAVNQRYKSQAEQLIYRTQSAAWAACNMSVGTGMTASCRHNQCEVNMERSLF